MIWNEPRFRFHVIVHLWFRSWWQMVGEVRVRNCDISNVCFFRSNNCDPNGIFVPHARRIIHLDYDWLVVLHLALELERFVNWNRSVYVNLVNAGNAILRRVDIETNGRMVQSPASTLNSEPGIDVS